MKHDHRTNNPRAWSKAVGVWLPSRGSALLVLLAVLGLLIYDQRVEAFPFGTPEVASTAGIPYQGRLADANGIPLNGSYALTFKLYSVSSGGSSLWNEAWSGGNSVQVNAGLFSVMLGSITPIPTSLISTHDSLWLGIAVGADSEMTPRVQLGSAPFAMGVRDGSVTSAKLDAIDGYSFVSSQESTTSTTPVSLTTSDIVTFTLEQPQLVNIYYGATMASDATHPAYMRLSIDGGPAVDDTLIEIWNSSATTIASFYQTQLAAGTHTISARYNTQAGGTAFFWRRKIHVFVISQ